MKMTRRLATGIAAALTVGGFAAGAAFAGNGSEAVPSATTTTSVVAGGMMGGSGMMDGDNASMGAMSTMMASGGMDAMHAAMHEAMSASMPAEVVAACEQAHAQMIAARADNASSATSIDHAAHHRGG